MKYEATLLRLPKRGFQWRVTGSFSRGEANRHSDLDSFIFGKAADGVPFERWNSTAPQWAFCDF